MTFIYWLLFIICFFISLFVIIKALLKKYPGWKGFFISLPVLNLLGITSYLLVLVFIFSLEWSGKANNAGAIGLGFILIAIGLYILLPLSILDTISILFYVGKKFLNGPVSTGAAEQAGSTKQLVYAILFVICLGLI